MKHHERTIGRAVALGALLTALGSAGLGCASTPAPTQELMAARSAYDDAHDGAAGRRAPDKLYEAKKALDRAERAYQDDPGSDREKQLSYIALRLSEVAMAQARLLEAQRSVATQHDRFERVRRVVSEHELADTKQQLNDEMYASSELEAKLAREQTARRDAEQEAAQLKSMLAELAKLRSSERAMTVSVSGSVLFETGKSTLLPTASRVLDEVARALKDQESERTIVIEGHTDSVGNDAANIALSLARAEAVRGYLIGHGIHPARIKAVGKGETQPITSNDTPEGRAQNRRVEIIIGKRPPRDDLED